MSIPQRLRKVMMVAALAVTAVAAVGAGTTQPEVVEAQTGPCAGGEYHALTPARIFDTRPPGINDVAPLGKKPTSLTGYDFDVQVTGLGGVPADPSRVLAVVANVTVVQPEAAGWMAVRPSGTPMPDPPSSLVNFTAGRTVPNTAIVGVGADGKITVRLRATGRAHVVIDVSGWISTSSHDVRGARLVPVGPGRVLDTRRAGGSLGSEETRSLTIRGANSFQPAISSVVPNRSSVSAVMVNIVAINRQPASRTTYVSATPTPTPAGSLPTTANVNLAPGIAKTSMAIIPIGDDGRIHFFNFAGDMHLAIDVLGYFESNTDQGSTGRIVPLDAPFRALDTRAAVFGRVPLGNGAQEEWSFQAFADSVEQENANGVQEFLGPQSALIGNLTATDLRRIFPSRPVSTYLTAYPGNVSRPLVSNVNLAEGPSVPNMSLVRYGSTTNSPNSVKVYNHAGSVHYVLDVYAVVLS
jgi:hypothetical protein